MGCQLIVVVILGGQRERLVIDDSACRVDAAIVIFLFVAAYRPLEAGAKAGPPQIVVWLAEAAVDESALDDLVGKRFSIQLRIGRCTRETALPCGIPCLVRVLDFHLRVFGFCMWL